MCDYDEEFMGIKMSALCTSCGECWANHMGHSCPDGNGGVFTSEIVSLPAKTAETNEQENT